MTNTTDHFFPPAAAGLPAGTLEAAEIGANRLDAWARTPHGRNFLAHALVQLARTGWLRTEPGDGFEPMRDPEPAAPAVVEPPADRAAEPVREQLLHCLDFSACQTHGYASPEKLLAAYDTSRTPSPAGQTTPSRRAGLRAELVTALGRIKTVPPVAHRQEQADHVLAVLYREWPWLRAEAEDAAPTDRAAVLREAAQRLYTALFPAVYADLGQKAAEGVNRAVSELRRMADVQPPAPTDDEDDELVCVDQCGSCDACGMEPFGTPAEGWREAARFLRRTARASGDRQGALHGARLIEAELRRMADETPDAQTARPVTPMTVYLSTPCDTCDHTLNWHRNDVGCTVPRCVCGRFQEPAAERQDEEA